MTRLALTGITLVGLCAVPGVSSCGRPGHAPATTPIPANPTAPPSLVGARIPQLYYFKALSVAGISGTVKLSLAVTAEGRVDTAATTVVSATNEKFLDSVNVRLAAWRLRPARLNGKPVPGELPVTLAFRPRTCTWPDSMTRQFVRADTTPARVELSVCTPGVFGPLFLNPKYVKTVRTKLEGLWSYGFEDGYYTPCHSVNIHINAHGITDRLMRPDFRGMDTVTVPIMREVAALGAQIPGTHRYFVAWEVELTGPKRNRMAVYTFKPLRLLEVKRWEEKSCVVP